MDGYSISQVAERTGFAPSALRFYEQSGLVQPERTAAGYRSYDEHDLEVLGFIGRAKGFGLSLEEITGLLVLLDDDRCAPVQDRLRDLVEAKIRNAQTKIAELVAFTAELRAVSATLLAHTPDGPCDESCGCTSDSTTGVSLAAGPATAGSPAIACTLAADQVPGRIEDWQQVLAGAAARELIEGGVRVRFSPGVDLAALASLAAAEQGCCRFFTFVLTIDDRGVALAVTGPDEARPVIEALTGAVA